MSFEPNEIDNAGFEQDGFQYVAEPELLSDPEAVAEQTVELETSFLHPSSLVFTVISQLRQNLIPAILAVFGAARGNWGFVAIAAGIFVLSIAAATIRYLTLRYSIQNGELTVKSGMIFRRIRKIPTSRIQNIDLVQNILHRLFGVAEVRVETASGTEPEATLRVLSIKQVEQLRAKVRSATVASTDGKQEETQSSFSQNSAAEVLRIPTTWLLKAGLASNRGMVLIGFLFGIYYQYLPDDERDFRNVRDQIQGFSAFLPDFGDGWQSWLSMIAAAILLLALIRLLGVGWFVLRFFGYRLTRQGEDFKISCGLFTKVSATVPIKKIQFISIHRSLIMRWLGLASIRIETAGGAGKDSEDATTTVSKRWFIPVVPEKRIQKLMNIIRHDLDWREKEFQWKPLAARATSRFVRIALVVSAILMLCGVAAWRPWGWIPGLVLCPFLVWYFIRRSRSNKYVRIGDGVIFRSGVMTKKTSITFFDRIQGASYSQSPFDRRWGMGTLTVDTAAAGPANHTISIRYLDEHFAANEYQEILRLSSGRALA